MSTNKDADKAGSRMSTRALQTILGEREAAEFIAWLQANKPDSDELAEAFRYGAALGGLCAVLAYALGVCHV